MFICRLSDIVEEADRKLDPLHAAEAGLLSVSAQPTPSGTPRLLRKNSSTRTRASDIRKETEAQKLRDFTKGAFTTCEWCIGYV